MERPKGGENAANSTTGLTFLQRWKLQFLPYRMGFRKLSNNFLEAHYLVMSSVMDLDRRLTLQERKLIMYTVLDMLRLVPFAIVGAAPGGVIGVMAMVKYTPSLLPTTFHIKPSALESLEPDAVQDQMDVEVKRSIHAFAKSLHESQLDYNSKLQQLMQHVDRIYCNDSWNDAQALDQLTFSEFTDQDILDVLSDVQLEQLATYFNKSYASLYGSLGTYKYPILRYQLKRHASKITALDTTLVLENLQTLPRVELLNACRDRGILRAGDDADQTRVDNLCADLKAWLQQTNEKAMPVLLLAIIRLNQGGPQKAS